MTPRWLRLLGTGLALSGLAAMKSVRAEDLPPTLTPPVPATPRINGPDVFGVRPGSPFLYTIPATGDRPMQFGAEGLPDGLHLDPATGRITGVVLGAEGRCDVVLTVTNALGEAEKPFRIIVAEKIALTPPMGWNGWNCYTSTIDQQKVLRIAHAMVSSGLINHGWSYVNIDDAWQGRRGGEYHAIQPSAKFPDIKAMVDEIHGLGLKAGIYSTPWITSYANYCGGSSDVPSGAWSQGMANDKYHHLGKISFVQNDARQWADWGFDYLKYDWYRGRLPEVMAMSRALRASGRDIVYSLSNSANFADGAALARWANCWRTGADLCVRWADDPADWMCGVSEAGFAQERWAPFSGPGHWNDPDMLELGWVSWGKGGLSSAMHPSQLTPDEQYTHMSMWCMLSAPLIFGGDPNYLDPFTLGLLSNDEVLAIDQDALGNQAVRMAAVNGIDIYMKLLEDGSKAIGFFNRDSRAETVRFNKFNYIGFQGKKHMRDLWRQKDLPGVNGSMDVSVPAHGVLLVRAWSEER